MPVNRATLARPGVGLPLAALLLALGALLSIAPTPRATAVQEGTQPMNEADAQPSDIAMLGTNMGDIYVQVDFDRAPITSANFMRYIEEGHYVGTVFHRVVKDFVIQGGGFTADMILKKTRDPIPLEIHPELSNLRGTLSMARTNDPNSATSQFFVNVVDNNGSVRSNLDPNAGSPGYAVFGKVVRGMDVVDKVHGLRTGTFNVGGALLPLQGQRPGSFELRGGNTYQDVPIQDAVVVRAKRLNRAEARMILEGAPMPAGDRPEPARETNPG